MPGYILYARKSSESEDRQVLSIGSQIRELQDLARSRGLDVVSVLSEAKSAKAPGRPIFSQMLSEIRRGRVQGILCWKLDRLARNPVDGGALIWALDQGKLTDIVTRDKTFSNRGDEKFWMQLEFGMAKKYVDDLSDNVKRGNRAKLEQGWLPGIPPLGYVNDLATKTIIPDPERFRIVRGMWDSVLSGRSPAEVVATANGDWGLRTRREHRRGGKPLTATNFYLMLSNPFYYGLIVRNGESYAGAHTPMISRDEFERVQELLGRPNRRHHKRYLFAFTGLIRCGECSAMITAEEKVNRYGSRYVYYRCTKRKRGTSCGQRTIRAERLEDRICALLANVAIDDDYTTWAVENLRHIHQRESHVRHETGKSVHSALLAVDGQIASLLDLRLRGLVSDEEYAMKKQALVTEQIRLKEHRTDTEGRAARWLELCERAFLFANQAPRRFREGGPEEKRQILVALGSNFVLRDRVLTLEPQKPFLLIAKGAQTLARSKHSGIASVANTPANQAYRAVTTVWGALVDGMRTFFQEHPDLIQWPRFCLQGKDVKEHRPLS